MKTKLSSLISFFIVILLCITACKVNVDTPEPEEPKPATQTTKPAPSPDPAPDPDPQVSYELKTGLDVTLIFAQMGVKQVATTFAPSSEKPSEEQTVYYLDLEEKNVPVWYDSNSTTIFFYANGVTTSGGKGKLLFNEDSAAFFSGLKLLENLDVTKFDSSNVVVMANMFGNCSSLKTLNLTNFDTSKVTQMDRMFENCAELTDLNLSGFNTSKVNHMMNMFSNCKKLTTLNLSSFDTSEVTAMCGMFSYCSALTNLNISSFNTRKVGDMREMFMNCSSLITLDLSNCNTSSVQDMMQMFEGCTNLTTITASPKFVTNALQDSSQAMFDNCPKLEGGEGTKVSNYGSSSTYARIDGGEDNPGFFTEVRYELKPGAEMNGYIKGKAFLPSPLPPADNITTINYLDIQEKNVPVWYDSATNTTYYYAKYVTTSGALGRLMMNADSSGMFMAKTGIETIDISVFDSRNVTNMKDMFSMCFNLKTVNVSHFNTSQVTNMQSMFGNCHALTTLDVSHFDTTNVENMVGMFMACLVPFLDVSRFNTSKVTRMDSMFTDCAKITKLDLSNWDTSSVKDMSGMFSSCDILTTITVSEKFVTSALENGKGTKMFFECSNLVGGNGTTYDENHADYTYARIDGGTDSSTPGYFTLKESTD